VRSTAAPYTESRLTRSVANERVGFPVVEQLLILCRRVPLLVRGGQVGAGVRLAAGRHQGALHQVPLHLRHPPLSSRKEENEIKEG
jgi:hypothetical protein